MMKKLLFLLMGFLSFYQASAQTDLSLEIQVDRHEVEIYSNYTYTITLQNTGSQAATGVEVNLETPDGLVFTSADVPQGQYFNWTGDWRVGTVAAGQSLTMELVLYTLIGEGSVEAYAQVAAMNETDTDSTPGNGSCCTPNEDDEASTANTGENTDSGCGFYNTYTASIGVPIYNEQFSSNSRHRIDYSLSFLETSDGYNVMFKDRRMLSQDSFIQGSVQFDNLGNYVAGTRTKKETNNKKDVTIEIDDDFNMEMVYNQSQYLPDGSRVPIHISSFVQDAESVYTVVEQPTSTGYFFVMVVDNGVSRRWYAIQTDFYGQNQRITLLDLFDYPLFADRPISFEGKDGAIYYRLRIGYTECLIRVDKTGMQHSVYRIYGDLTSTYGLESKLSADSNYLYTAYEYNRAFVYLQKMDLYTGEKTYLSYGNPSDSEKFFYSPPADGQQYAPNYQIEGIQPTLDGGLLFSIQNRTPTSRRTLLGKYDASGILVWITDLGDSSYGHVFYPLGETSDGGALFTGLDLDEESNVEEYIILKLTKNGQLTPDCEGENTGMGADIELSLTATPTTYDIYQNVTYTLTATNTGTQAATGVMIDFPKPTGLVYTNSNASQGQYTEWTGEWQVGTIAPGQTATLELVLFTLVDGTNITNYAQVAAMNETDADSTPGNGSCCTPNEDDEVAATISPTNSGNNGSSITLTCPNDINLQLIQGQNIISPSWSIPPSSTNCSNGGLQLTQVSGFSPGTSVTAGTYTITYNATDACGNTASCSFTVTVQPFTENTGTVDYTAKDQVTPYTGFFRPGVNMGYNPPWQDVQLADIAAGNDALGINGIGAKSMRPGMFEVVTEIYGYDIRLDAFEHYQSLGMNDMTMIVGFPVEWHRDLTDYCGDGTNSALFANLYTDIWDGGANGTPYNDDNYYAAYLYQVVDLYKDYIKFWEIWNEPGFDLTGNIGWRPPGDPAGNWWDRDPYPCESILHAPIEHYIRTLRISWEIIKTLAPDDYVVVAGVGFESFLDAILRNTDNPNDGEISPDYPHRGGAYFDVMGFHTYPDIDGSVREYNSDINGFEFFRHSDAAAKGVNRRQNNYQAILESYGYDGETYPKKEWIVTEFNVPRVQFRDISMSGGNDLQINYIAKATIQGMKAGIHQMHAYTLGDKKRESEANTEFDLLGMYKYLPDAYPDGAEVNPIGISYKTISDLLFGTRYDAQRTAALNLPSNVDGGAFRTETGEYVYVLWAVTMTDQSEFASATYSFPGGLGINQLFKKEWDYSRTGQTNAVSTQNIALTGRPIYLTETQSRQIQGRIASEQATHLSVKKVLPNPAVDYVDLLLQSVEAMPVTVDIYDATGTLQQSRTTEVRKGYNTLRFDIANLPSGMYFIHVRDSNRFGTKIRFIKQQM